MPELPVPRSGPSRGYYITYCWQNVGSVMDWNHGDAFTTWHPLSWLSKKRKENRRQDYYILNVLELTGDEYTKYRFGK